MDKTQAQPVTLPHTDSEPVPAGHVAFALTDAERAEAARIQLTLTTQRNQRMKVAP